MSLDIERHPDLIDYLRRSGRIDRNIDARARTLAGGVSNRTVWVGLSDGRQWVLKQALTKLRVAADWFSDVARIRREALGLRHLAELCPAGAITPLVFEDDQENLLAMEAVREPHENWKGMLMRGEIDEGLVREFGSLLSRIHRRSAERRAELEHKFADRSFFESLRVEPYYQYAASRVAAAREFIAGLVAETRETRTALVHGDYSPKNVLVREGRLVLLDHEVIHWGDPAFDVGFALTHFLSKGHHLREHRTQLAEAARRFMKAYGETAIEGRSMRHTLGCLLARVAGRSPLEYLTPEERERQERVAVELMRRRPPAVAELVDEFFKRV